jgi:aminoglycoside phosphotransferase
MQVNREDELVRVGSLVMWNVEDSIDYGCMGLVVHSKYIDYTETDEGIVHYFNIQWADDSLVRYDSEEIEYGKLKVVKF